RGKRSLPCGVDADIHSHGSSDDTAGGGGHAHHDDSFNASRIMENYQQQHHKIGGRSASSGLEELIMGCTPSSSTDIKEERSIRNPQEADWLKYSTFWPDQDHPTNGDSSSFVDSGNKEGNGSRHSNDIKVDIPEYDRKLDPDEFVKWLRTVKLVFDYKQTTEENEVKIIALKLRKYASTWWSNVCLKRERLGKQRFEQEEVSKQKLGHIASECPNKRLITLADFELAGGYEFGVAPSVEQPLTIESEEEVVGPDVGELLVVRWALNNVTVREEKL
nr:NAC domain-containing protein [Tanacetum cinerariifolium]